METMKKWMAVLLLLCVGAGGLQAQRLNSAPRQVDFKFSAETMTFPRMNQVERTLTQLLTEMNQASLEGRDLRLNNISMTTTGRARLNSLWQNFHVVCMTDRVRLPMLNKAGGMEVRQIPVDYYAAEDGSFADHRELVIELTADGIVSLIVSAKPNNKIVNKSEYGQVINASHEAIIRAFTENLRAAYEERDINFLEKVFSEDALIITGTEVLVRSGAERSNNIKKVKYRVEDKQAYLGRMRTTFRNVRSITLDFDNVEVSIDPIRENFYGVTLRQNWRHVRTNNTKYEDEGYLFLLWEFRDNEAPIIHVRTWQPLSVGRNSVFSLEDFMK